MVQSKTVGILLFHEVEVLDFAGPFEVFSIATEPGQTQKLFSVKTIAVHKEIISARNGLKVLPDYDFSDCPALDLLIIPGGYGAEEIEIKNPVLLNWIRQRASETRIVASICTGAFLLAEAGLLDGKHATTHWMDIDRLAHDYPEISVVRNVKLVDEGAVLTAGGISAGINLAFHLIKNLIGADAAAYTAKRMEYDIDITEL